MLTTSGCEPAFEELLLAFRTVSEGLWGFPAFECYDKASDVGTGRWE